MRLAKYIASRGVCSRRKAEEMIAAGRVQVNGGIAEITTPVEPKADQILIDGSEIVPAQKIFILLNKPKGYLSTCQPDREKGKSVLELLDIDVRIYPVGRLDRESRGLLILTNDGDLTYKLSHPSFEKEKEYVVSTKREINSQEEQLLREGICLYDKHCRFHSIIKTTDMTYRIVLKQGLKRQIRKMIEFTGNKVVDLQRIRIDELSIDGLAEGKWRYLTNAEVVKLKK